MTGPLCLVGSGEYTSAMAETDRALLKALGTPRPHVAVVPTASGLEPGMPQVWNARGVQHFEALGARVSPLLMTERAHCFDQNHINTLVQADFVYFSGGNPNHLIESWRETPAWDAVRERWRNGAVLAGCSAGAMMLGAYTIRMREAMNTGHALWLPAMNIATGLAVLPHFDRMRNFMSNDRFFGLIKAAPSGTNVVGIDEDTALVFAVNRWQVSGRQRVTVFGPDAMATHFAHGQSVPLTNLTSA